MDHGFVICSFYTNDLYRKFSEKLGESCDRLSIPRCIQEIPDAGGWTENCKNKASFVRTCLEMVYPDQNVVWVDSDAVLRGWPTLFRGEPTFDLAARVTDNLIHGGTMYFKNIPEVREFVRAWGQETRKHRGFDDRKGFLELAACMGLEVEQLPAAYDWCRRFDQGEPRIEQFMISRLLDQEKEGILLAECGGSRGGDAALL